MTTNPFDLGSVQPANAQYRPEKVIAYGVQGLGKTTFGCTWERPILLRSEDGGDAFDVPTFPAVLTGLNEFAAAINALHGDHPYRTLVIDSIDWLEPLVWGATLARLNQFRDPEKQLMSIEELGYGKGYVEADNEWRYVLAGLDSLRMERGMHIVLIAHAEIKRFEPPDGEPFDRYQIKLHKRAWALCQEWASQVLFCNYRRRLMKTKDGGQKGQDKFRAEGSGERVIHADERPAYVAKNRWGLPHEIFIGTDKTWSAYHEALHKATGGRYVVPQQQTATSATVAEEVA